MPWQVLLLAAAIVVAGLLATVSSAPPPAKDVGAVLVAPEREVQIFIPRRAKPEERRAAEDLRRVLLKMGAATVQVRREPWWQAGDGIYIGDTQMARRRLADVVAPPPVRVGTPADAAPFAAAVPPTLPLPPSRWDQIAISARDGVLVLAGSDAGASELAVYWLLQQHGDVRWWIPGPLGEDIPEREFWIVPQIEQRLQPSYLSRELHGLNSEEARLWGRRNLLRGHARYNHNLHRIFPQSLAVDRPELFPLFKGQPYDPSVNPMDKAHPNMALPEVAELAAAAANEFFARDPSATFYSISPDDHVGFGDVEQYAGLVDPSSNFRELVDYSPLVFTFANRVARIVAREHPGRYVGMLSYFVCEQVPPFPVEPNVMPMITADRSQWYDPAFKQEDLDLVERWAANGPELVGTWDYIYGEPYVIPRVLLQSTKESIPALYQRGVRVYFAELRPVWGLDAPKSWLTARLLWDADADPVALEEEFFLGYYGGGAGYRMRTFFQACDAVWNSQPPPARWIKYYGDADQALLFPPGTLDRLHTMLKRARAESLSRESQDRIELTIGALAPAGALAAALPPHYAIAGWTADRPSAELLAAAPGYIATRRELKEAAEAQRAGESLNRWGRPLPYLLVDDPLPGRLAMLRPKLTAAERIELAGQLGDWLQVDADSEQPAALSAILRPSEALLDPVFAHGLDGWTQGNFPSAGMEIDVGEDGSVEIRNTRGLRFSRAVQVTPNHLYRITLPCSGTVSPASTVSLSLSFVREDGSIVTSIRDRLPPGSVQQGVLAVCAAAPEGIHWAYVNIDILGQEPGDSVRFGSSE